MAGELPPDLGEGPTDRRPAGALPSYPTQPASRSRGGRAIALTALATAGIAVVLAAVGLIVALTHPTRTASSSSTTAPSYTSADTTAAQLQLCDTYKLAAKAVQVDTTGSDKALARIATTNGAIMLDMAAANPALDPTNRDAARALAAAYTTAYGGG